MRLAPGAFLGNGNAGQRAWETSMAVRPAVSRAGRSERQPTVDCAGYVKKHLHATLASYYLYGELVY